MNRFQAPAPLSPTLTIALMAQKLAKPMRAKGWVELNDLKNAGYSPADIADFGIQAIEEAKRIEANRQRSEATRKKLAEGALTTATAIALAFFVGAIFLAFAPDTAMAAPSMADLTTQIDTDATRAISASFAALGLAALALIDL